MNPIIDVPQDESAGAVTRHLIFATLAQAGMVLLAGLNLSLRFSAQPVGSLDLIRWREIFSLTLIVPVSVGIIFQMVWILEQGRRDARWPLTLMGVSTCLLGVSMGVHEPVNALPSLQRLSAVDFWNFWDEIFSHIVFYLAFIGISLSLLWCQMRNPLPVAMSRGSTAVFGCIAIMSGVGIFLALVPGGAIGVDLAILALVLGAAEWMRKGRPLRQRPIAIVIEWPYLLAFLGLIAQRFLSGRW